MRVSESEERHLRWDSCLNVRDLGGYPTTDAGETRWRAIVRADTLGRLTPVGSDALLAYGVRTVIDLRHAAERARDPCPIAEHPAIVYRQSPLTGAAHGTTRAFLAVADSIATLRRNVPVIGRSGVGNAAGAAAIAALYRFALEVGKPGIARIMRTIARAPDGGVLFFCHAGRDRTGLIAGLLLDVAGVARETIVADYILSDACLAPLQSVGRAHHAAVGEAMQAALGHLDTRYGGSSAYLRMAGVTAQEMALLHARLRS